MYAFINPLPVIEAGDGWFACMRKRLARLARCESGIDAGLLERRRALLPTCSDEAGLMVDGLRARLLTIPRPS